MRTPPMKFLLVVSICILLLLTVCTYTQADGWRLDLKLHQFPDFSDATQRLTKDLGDFDLMLGARQFKWKGDESNHLNLQLSAGWWGVEYVSGENVTNEMRSFSLFAPGQKKAQTFNTPTDSVLHSYIHKEFGGGFVQFDWFKRDAQDEMKVHVRTEF